MTVIADSTNCTQISRGLSPAVSIAATVAAATNRGFKYRLITGKPAAEAKNSAAREAFEAQRDLLLVEDDVLVPTELWDKAARNCTDVMVGSAIMRNGELNCWYLDDRLVYSGTVWLRVPWLALFKIGDPWFAPRDLEFNGENGGEWIDKGENADGQNSDCWFYYRCWQEGIRATVAGFVTHLITPLTSRGRSMNQPIEIKPLGMMNCQKTVA